MVKLDIKNRKILYELDINGRISYSALAKKVGLSKDSVINRIRDLEANGIIKGFYAVIDYGKLGYTIFQIYLKLQSIKPEKEKELLEMLEKDKRVAFINTFEGGYDLGFWVIVKEVKELFDFWDYLSMRFGNYIRKRKYCIISKVLCFPKSFFLEKKNDVEMVFTKGPSMTDVYSNLMLINELIKDARISVIELSRKLDMTPKTVSSKMKKLEDEKVIVAYKAKYDLSTLGYQYFKLSFMLKDPGQQKEIGQYIKEHPNIVFRNFVVGGYDIEIEVQVKSLEELKSLMDGLRENFAENIRDFNYMMFFKEQKLVHQLSHQ